MTKHLRTWFVKAIISTLFNVPSLLSPLKSTESKIVTEQFFVLVANVVISFLTNSCSPANNRVATGPFVQKCWSKGSNSAGNGWTTIVLVAQARDDDFKTFTLRVSGLPFLYGFNVFLNKSQDGRPNQSMTQNLLRNEPS